jgi:hypothetical protein
MDEKAIGSTADCADDALSRPPRSQRGDDDDGYQREHHHQFAEPATWYWRVVSVEHLGPFIVARHRYRASTLRAV